MYIPDMKYFYFYTNSCETWMNEVVGVVAYINELFWSKSQFLIAILIAKCMAVMDPQIDIMFH